MKLKSRLVEGALALVALALLAALLYPARPAPLPAQANRTGLAQPAEAPPTRPAPATRPSLAEVASLFGAAPPASVPAEVSPAPTPERVPWLRYIAFATGASGETTYFFKNDQTGRVLVLALRRPRDGWNLAALREDAWLLENGEHSYLVTRK